MKEDCTIIKPRMKMEMKTSSLTEQKFEFCTYHKPKKIFIMILELFDSNGLDSSCTHYRKVNAPLIFQKLLSSGTSILCWGKTVQVSFLSFHPVHKICLKCRFFVKKSKQTYSWLIKLMEPGSMIMNCWYLYQNI